MVLTVFTCCLIVAAAVCFFLGITEPLMIFERFFFFETTASLLQIIDQLRTDDAWPLALVIFVFSILLPVAKLAYLLAACLLPARFLRARALLVLSSVSKWSMLDVLVVAIVIVATKTTGLAAATIQPGLWFFTAAVVLMAIATLLVQRRLHPIR